MDYKKLERAVYCEGFVEDFIEKTVAFDSSSPHMIELGANWTTLSEAFTELRKENSTLQSQLDAARNALS